MKDAGGFRPHDRWFLLLLGAMVGAILFTKRDPGQED